jgi:DNA helicase HerA-like ATPase
MWMQKEKTIMDKQTSSPRLDKPRATDEKIRLGLISTAFGVESTQSEFYFWADRGLVLESGQIVFARQSLPLNNVLGVFEMTVYGVIERVNRLSSSRSIEADMRERDGDAGKERLWPRGNGTERTGTTYAYCRVIGIEPNVLTPLHEDTEVFLAGELEAGQGYGYPNMIDSHSALPVGLLLNGGITTAGRACLDIRYILGEYGGHINVTGKAGTATKTSFLLNIIKHLMLFAEDTMKRGDELYIVPIVFNAKGSDLMWIGYKNKKFNPADSDWLDYKTAWGDDYWRCYTTPFRDVQLYSYPVSSGGVRGNLPPNTRPYSWSLQNVIEWGTWRYLFSGEDRSQELLMGLMFDIFQYVSKPYNSAMSGFTLDREKVLDFDGLVNWVNLATGDDQHYLRSHSHSPSTIEAAVRRLRNTLNSNPVLLKHTASGEPPIFARVGNFGPIVVDIDGLPPAAQRFVVASIIEYLKVDRRNNAGKKQVYVLMLDELNQYAGKNNRDEVARLFEHVAAQLRSQGIILFGAQQKASDVIEIVFENSATKVLGNTGSGEIGQSIWTRELSTDVRARALQLQKEEKLVLQDGFRYPMALKFPLNPWATKEADAKVFENKALLDREQEL